MPLNEGHVLNNRYRITGLLEQSDYGAVYSALDQNSNAQLMIEEIADASESAQQRFVQRAAQFYQMRHPNLPVLLEAFSVSGQGLYLVEQQVEGESLQAIFDRTDGPLPGEVVLNATHQVCEALVYLHSQTPPVVHGDLKPANIRLSGAELRKAVLLGLGVASKYDSQVGAIAGARVISPGFSPPEFYGKGTIDVRSDVYALGATLYYLLTGKRLPESVLIKGRDVQPPKPPHETNPQVSPLVSSAIMRAIQVDSANRFPTIADFKNALRDADPGTVPATAVAQAPPKTAARGETGGRLGWVVGGLIGALLLILLLIGGWFGSRYLISSNPTATPTLTSTSEPSATPTSTITSLPPTATFTPPVQPSPTAPTDSVEDPRGVPVVLVPAGAFLMGSNFGGFEEQPEHQVELDAYHIDLHEVTNARYAECVAEGACEPPVQFNSASRASYYDNPEFADFPVVMVNWSMAQAYCEWRGGSLPTEAQWEKGARGTEFRVFPWMGEAANCTLANFWNNEPGCQRDTTAVGSYLEGVSPFGLFDMAGNVWEWVLDWFDPDYYAGSPTANPTGPDSGEHKVVRGGSFSGGPGQIRVTTRGRNLPGNGYNYVGFRCVSPP